MRLGKGTLMGFSALALVALLLNLGAPKAVHGAVVTLVQAVNTMANAVPTSDAGNAAEPFEWTVGGNPAGDTTFVAPSTTADGRTVRRLVVEQVTLGCQSLSAPAVGVALSANNLTGGTGSFSSAGYSQTINGGSQFPIQESFFFIPFPPSPVAGQQVLSQPTRLYVDPGVTVHITLNPLGTPPAGQCFYSAFGHLIVQ